MLNTAEYKTDYKTPIKFNNPISQAYLTGV